MLQTSRQKEIQQERRCHDHQDSGRSWLNQQLVDIRHNPANSLPYYPISAAAYGIIELTYEPDIGRRSLNRRVKGKFSMPTQEERLETVEYNLRQFKTETIKAYGDMAFEMTIIKGLAEDAIQRLAALSNTTEKRFEQVNIHLDGMDAHLENMNTRLGRLETRLGRLETKVDGIETQLTEHKTLLAQILARLPEKP